MKEVNIESREQSEGAMIYRSYQAGHITEAEYHALNAQLSYALLGKAPVLKITFPERDVEQYINGRISGGELSYQLGMRLGNWINFAARVINENSHLREHYEWCLSKLDAAKYPNETTAFTRRLEMLKASLVPPVYNLALKVQEKDAISRESARRNSER